MADILLTNRKKVGDVMENVRVNGGKEEKTYSRAVP